MRDFETETSDTHTEEVPLEPPGLLRRLRGVLVVRFRSLFTRPVTRRVPVGWYRRYHRLRHRVFPWRYTDADPLAIRLVDPASIERSILEHSPDRPQFGRICGGSWDQRYDEFDQSPVFRAVFQHFERGRPWRDTPLYAYFISQLRRFGNAWGYTSVEGFDERCAELERLYESLQEHGYRRQDELSSGDWQHPPVALFDEINVDIGHDGQFLWRAYGQHRLAMAKILGIDEIPVLVQRRHKSWQHVRNTMQTYGRSAISDDLVGNNTHPDLVDLLPEESVN